MNEAKKSFWKKLSNIIGNILFMFLCCSAGFVGGCITEYCYATSAMYDRYQSSLSGIEEKQRAVKGQLEFQGRLNQTIRRELEYERRENKKIATITKSERRISDQERQAQQQNNILLEQIREIQTADIDIYERNEQLIRLIESTISTGAAP